MIQFIKITENQYLIQEEGIKDICILGYILQLTSNWFFFVDKQTAPITYTAERLSTIMNKLNELNNAK